MILTARYGLVPSPSYSIHVIGDEESIVDSIKRSSATAPLSLSESCPLGTRQPNPNFSRFTAVALPVVGGSRSVLPGLAVRVVAVTNVGVRTSTLRHRGGPIQKPIVANVEDAFLDCSTKFSDRFVYSSYFVPLLVAFDDATTPVLPNYKVGALRKLAERGIISPTRIVRLLSYT